MLRKTLLFSPYYLAVDSKGNAVAVRSSELFRRTTSGFLTGTSAYHIYHGEQ
jgi:hypothetical protein